METLSVDEGAEDALEKWREAVDRVRREGAPQALAECLAQVRNPELYVRVADARVGLEPVTITEADVGRFLDLSWLLQIYAASRVFWEAYTVLWPWAALGYLLRDSAAYMWDAITGWRESVGYWLTRDKSPVIAEATSPIKFAVPLREAEAWAEYVALDHVSRIHWCARQPRQLLCHRAGAILGVLWARVRVALEGFSGGGSAKV